MAHGEKPNLAAIARETGSGYSTVKKYWSQMRQERNTDGMPAVHVVNK
jgi:hypothetical protein